MTRTLSIRGVRYAFDERGQGPLVLFGHGLLFDRTMFQAQATALSARFRCVCLDWPGHGESGYRGQGWSADDLVADVVELIGALGEHRAILVGLSQGGAIFTRVALAHPQHVRALVVMDANPDRPPAPALDWMDESSAVLRSGDEARIDAWFQGVEARMFSATTRRDQPELLAAWGRRFRSHDRAGLARAVRLGQSYQSVIERLSSIEAPTLVVWGADDSSSPRALARHYLDRIAGSQFVEVAAAGHSAPVEQPAAVSAALERFVAELPAE